jgi:hypothetical protein
MSGTLEQGPETGSETSYKIAFCLIHRKLHVHIRGQFRFQEQSQPRPIRPFLWAEQLENGSHLCLGFPSGIFRSCFSDTTLYWPSHL